MLPFPPSSVIEGIQNSSPYRDASVIDAYCKTHGIRKCCENCAYSRPTFLSSSLLRCTQHHCYKKGKNKCKLFFPRETNEFSSQMKHLSYKKRLIAEIDNFLNRTRK